MKINRKNNLIGKKFGKLKVLNISSKRKSIRYRYWVCICDCGTVKSIRSTHLTQGNVKSCGCDHHKRGKENCHWRGYQDIPSHIFSGIRIQAKNRNIPFKITIKQMWNIFRKQKGKCALSGMRLYFNSSSRTKDGNASLDRVDSSRGYSLNNIQWVDKNINKMKNCLSEEQFLNFCKSVCMKNKLL